MAAKKSMVRNPLAPVAPVATPRRVVPSCTRAIGALCWALSVSALAGDFVQESARRIPLPGQHGDPAGSGALLAFSPRNFSPKRSSLSHGRHF